MADHSTLTGTALHEPKGVATAAANQVYVANGTGSGVWTSQNFATAPVLKFKTADTVRTSTATLADDAHLTGIALAAGSSYVVEGVIFHDSANGTTGAKYAFQLVSGSLADSAIFYTGLMTNGSINSSGTVAITTAVNVATPGSTDSVKVAISGFVTTINATVLDLQTAQDAANATNTTFRKGSWLSFTKVP